MSRVFTYFRNKEWTDFSKSNSNYRKEKYLTHSLTHTHIHTRATHIHTFTHANSHNHAYTMHSHMHIHIKHEMYWIHFSDYIKSIKIYWENEDERNRSKSISVI